MALCSVPSESSRLRSRRPRLSLDVGALNQNVADYGEGLLARSAVDELTAEGSRDLEAEFNQLDDLCCAQRRGPRPRQSQFNQLKDFCQSVLPYAEFRAETLDGSYVNASVMQGMPGPSFIAAQGPMKHTVDGFWSMIVKHRATQIVALCRDEECENYLPPTSEPLSLLGGSLKVRFKSEEALSAASCTWSSLLEVTYGEDTWEVSRFHCSNWDDQGTISAAALLQLAELVSSGASRRTTLVHCRAGAGRTGCFIALCSLLADMEAQLRKLPQQTPCTSVARTVVEMRRRRPHMVQTSGQYELLYAALREWYGEQHNRPMAACEHEEEPVEHCVSNKSMATTASQDSLAKEDDLSVASTSTSLADFFGKDDISVASTSMSFEDFNSRFGSKTTLFSDVDEDCKSRFGSKTSFCEDYKRRFGSKASLFTDAAEDALPLLLP